MKTAKVYQPLRLLLLGVASTLMLFAFYSCSSKKAFLNSTVVPGAEGFVNVKKDDNQNYAIEISISGLASVDRLASDKKSYVVWMETDNGKTENLGQLDSSSGFMSKRMRASLKTVSSYKPNKVFITTENDSNAQYPGSEIVLTTDKF